MSSSRAACRRDGRDVLLSVWVRPGADREGPGPPREAPNRHGGPSQTAVTWHVRAPAIDGRANAALCRSVAGTLRVAPSTVAVVRGAAGRSKVLRIQGCDVDVVAAALDG